MGRDGILQAMAESVDLKSVVKNIVDGTLHQNLCRVCLLPLEEICESIFTKVCKDDQEFSVAEVLETVCQVKFSELDNFSVCADCFIMAYDAYKFYLLSKRSSDILDYYVEELERNVYSIENFENSPHDSLCVTLPEYSPPDKLFNFDVNAYLVNFLEVFNNDPDVEEEITPLKVQSKVKIENESPTKGEDENLVVVIDENGDKTFYKITEEVLSKINMNKNVEAEKKVVKPKQKTRKKRDPMILRQCSQCPVQYRFISKLKLHMKTEHNIDLFVCKICKAITEDKLEFEMHMKTHTNIHQCNICDMVFKKRDTIIAHLQAHERLNQSDGIHVCELCGHILPDEEQLKDHYDKRHIKKYTCFYCGRMYKGEMAFESHVKKHETHSKNVQKRAEPSENSEEDAKKGRLVCATCGRDFVDERSLMWHSRLHTNERPYACDVCGRAFVSVNRRNQHSLCAHTMPTKRCPLCPALFHLRSMVNTHIKKVHLKEHKRRIRSSKQQSVCWWTAPVPLQELSVPVHDKLVRLRTDDQSSEWLS